MVADLLTKGVPPKVFHEHTTRMGVMSLDDAQFQWEFVILNAFMSQTNFQLFQFIMFKVIFCRNKVFVYSHSDFGLKFDLTKVYGGPVGN